MKRIFPTIIICRIALLGAATVVAPLARAEGVPEQDLEIIVNGRAIDLIGITNAGSSGVVGYADFDLRPILRTGEMLETIPGLIATQHSGEGKANQYFLRGFNLDHGTDFDLVARDFGADFATALVKLPVGQWSGPIGSVAGVHLVRLTELVPPQTPPLADIRTQVVREWESRMPLYDSRWPIVLKKSQKPEKSTVPSAYGICSSL